MSWMDCKAQHCVTLESFSFLCMTERVKCLWIKPLPALQHRNTYCINGAYSYALHSNVFSVLLIRLPGFLAISSLKWLLVQLVLWNRSEVLWLFFLCLVDWFIKSQKGFWTLPAFLLLLLFLCCVSKSSRHHVEVHKQKNWNFSWKVTGSLWVKPKPEGG